MSCEETLIWLLAYLSGGIYDVTLIIDTIKVDGLCESALNSRIVGLDKMVLGELNHERRLAYVRRKE